jgi:F5/8 type C domain
MKHPFTFLVGALAASWLAVSVGCSADQPSARPNRKASSSTGAGVEGTSGSDGAGGDTDPVGAGTGGSGNVTSGGGTTGGTGVGAGGSASQAGGSGGIASGGAGGVSTGGVSGSGGVGGVGSGGAAGSSGAAGAGGTNVGGGQCNATCMQGSGCSTKSCWMVSANVFKTTTAIQPANAIDGDEKTRYSTGTDATGTEWFQIDLCRPAMISGINVYTGGGGGDAAEKYTVQVSLDAAQWTEVVHSDTPQAPRASITFTPVSARYVRYNQTAVATHWWSIHELDILCGGADGGA